MIAQAQDGSGTNNANFATPPDGRSGKMRMYVWTQTHPSRDGDLEAGIVIHEYAHGISTRLTGGPENSGCLGHGESGGMGEGWGDILATILRMKGHETKDSSFGMGNWVNAGNGIRPYDVRHRHHNTLNCLLMSVVFDQLYYQSSNVRIPEKGRVLWCAC